MSDDNQRNKVITGTARRRRWSAGEKLRIVEETFASGETNSSVARRNESEFDSGWQAEGKRRMTNDTIGAAPADRTPDGRVENAIMALGEADPDLAPRYDILVSIPSVSAITAFALVIDMPKLGTLENGQAAPLAGLAPSRGSPGNRPAAPSSAAAGPTSGRHSTYRR